MQYVSVWNQMNQLNVLDGIWKDYLQLLFINLSN